MKKKFRPRNNQRRLTKRFSPRLRLWALAAAIALLFNLPSLLTPIPQTPPGLVHTGFSGIDEIFYYACSNELNARGSWGIFYSNPFAFEPDAPRIYSQMYFVLNAWVKRLTGLSYLTISHLHQTLFGFLFLGLAGECFYHRFGQKKFFWPLILILFLGGGASSLLATLYTAGIFLGPFSGEWDTSAYGLWEWVGVWLNQLDYYEGFHRAWGMNLFRRLNFGPAVFYHTLFYAGWLSLLRGRWSLALLFSLLLWWAHPFTAINFALPLLATSSVLFFLDRKTPKRARTLRVVATLGLTALGLSYYLLYLPRFPLHASVQEQMMTQGYLLRPRELLPGLGALLLAPAFIYWIPPDWRARETIANTSLLVITAALTLHQYILGPFGYTVQPMHFEQGYLYFSLLFLSAQMLTRQKELKKTSARQTSAKPRKFRPTIILLTLAYLSLLPDNIFYYIRNEIPHTRRYGLTIDKETMQLIDFLKTYTPPRRILTLSLGIYPDWQGYAAIETPHSFSGGHPFNTPFIKKREKRMAEFLQTGDLALWAPNAPEQLIVPSARFKHFETTIRPAGNYKLIYQNSLYKLFDIQSAFSPPQKHPTK